MTDLFSLFDATERADIAVLVKPATHDDPLPPTWPANGIAPHPYASINRMMTGDEARELRADIDAHGLLERIVIFEGKILDGRNRYLECVALGRFAANVDWRTHPDFVEFGGRGWDADRGTDPLAFVWGMEVRRHRSAKDTALAAARYLRFIAELQPATPEAQTAKLRLPSQADIAKRHGISERLVNSAMVLLDRAEPEVIAAVEQGTLALTDAADVVSKLDQDEQRSIVAEPDRKAVKQKVKAVAPKTRKAPAVPDLPAPVSRTELANFAETVILEALRVSDKHGKAGASMSADLVVNAARKHDLVEMLIGGKLSLTRPMLLVLGKLRDMPEGKARKPARDEQQPDLLGPSAPPLGGEWSLTVGDLGKKHRAGASVFHEEDDTFSIAVSYDFGVRSGSEPFHGAYESFELALATACAKLRKELDDLAGATDSVTGEAVKGSAFDGVTWLDKWMKGKAIKLPDPIEQVVDQVTQIVAGMVDQQLAYDQLVEAQGDTKGHHTKASAEPILRAGRTAEIEWQRIADDIGHPLGTVQGWSFKLGMTGKGSGRSAPRPRNAEQAAA